MLSKRFVSDIVWKAQDDAGIKAYNSFSFRDIVDILSNKWADVYNKLLQVDEGFYGITTKLTSSRTTLPPFVKATIDIYAAKAPVGFNRYRYKESSQTNLQDTGTYHISGLDLYCPDVERMPGTNIWLYYVPQAPELLYTMNNREPRILKPDWTAPFGNSGTPDPVSPFSDTGIWEIAGIDSSGVVSFTPSPVPPATGYAPRWSALPYGDANYITVDTIYKKAWLRKYPISAVTPAGGKKPDNTMLDITNLVYPPELFPRPLNGVARPSNFAIRYFNAVYPYLFITYQNTVETTRNTFKSIIYRDILNSPRWTEYNPFDFIGKPSNVCFLATDFNVVTGMGVNVMDFGDTEIAVTSSVGNKGKRPRVKEIGFCPDTLVMFPDELVQRYLTAVLAERFVAKNNAADTQRAVADELAAATYAFQNYIGRDKSSWVRPEIVRMNRMSAWI